MLTLGDRTIAILARAATTSLLCTAVAASLLTFPAGIPWMIAFWLVWFSIARLRGQGDWMPLAICAVVLAIKGLPLSVSLIALWSAIIIVLALVLMPERWQPIRSRAKLNSIVIGLPWLLFAVTAFDWSMASHASHRATFSTDRPIVCIGDSLTAGVPPHGGFVPLLRERLTVPVIDLSAAGITSDEAIKRLPEMAAARPQAVVIEIGGHDFLRGRSRDQAREKLETIIHAARKAGAAVILMEIPRGFMFDPYRGLERQLARDHDLQLISDTAIRELVLWSPHAPLGLWTGGPYLSQDGLHPNALGNQRLADAVAEGLAQVFGPQVISDQR